MKVGDLVIMPPGENQMYRTGYDPDTQAVGIVVDLASQIFDPRPRVGIWWSDGDRIDYEPAAWLAVISESG